MASRSAASSKVKSSRWRAVGVTQHGSTADLHVFADDGGRDLAREHVAAFQDAIAGPVRRACYAARLREAGSCPRHRGGACPLPSRPRARIRAYLGARLCSPYGQPFSAICTLRATQDRDHSSRIFAMSLTSVSPETGCRQHRRGQAALISRELHSASATATRLPREIGAVAVRFLPATRKSSGSTATMSVAGNCSTRRGRSQTGVMMTTGSP